MTSPLNAALQQKLQESFQTAYSASWSIPASTSPLSESQLRFLQSCSVASIASGLATSNDPVLQFFIGVIQSTFTQLATTSVKAIISDIGNSNPQPLEETKSDKEIKPAQQKQEKSSPTALKAPALKPHKEHKTTGQSEPKGDHPPHSLGGKEPSLEAMKKIASSEFTKRVGSSVAKIVKDELIDMGNPGKEARAVQEQFVRHVGNAVKAGAATGLFLNKVEEMGWNGAVAETTKDLAISFIAKHSANAVTSLVGCSNPIWCAKVVTTVIVDTFKPIETAGPEFDERPPLPPSELSDVIRPREIHLDPAVPSFRAPR